MNVDDVMNRLSSTKSSLEQKHGIHIEFQFYESGWGDNWPAIVLYTLSKDAGWVATPLLKSKKRSSNGEALFNQVEIDAVVERLEGDGLWRGVRDQFEELVAKRKQEEIDKVARAAEGFTLDQLVPSPSSINSVTVDVMVPASLGDAFTSLPSGVVGSALSSVMLMLLPMWEQERELMELAELTPEQIGIYLMKLVLRDVRSEGLERGARYAEYETIRKLGGR